MMGLKIPPGKTGTREVAVSLLILFATVTVRVFFLMEPGVVSMYKEIYSSLMTGCIGFAAAAFGVHMWRKTKQGDDSGQTPGS